jgi:hypothetical protein
LQLNATLLTCDKKLPTEAEGHAIEVRGSIWVIEQGVENGFGRMKCAFKEPQHLGI